MIHYTSNAPTPLSFVLFFYCSRAHRDLHSFPTRRSSDLPTSPPTRSSSMAACHAGPSRSGRATPLSVAATPSRSRSEDRKSTRLNSSHEWISYAVFCLKKKKRQRVDTRTDDDI